MDIAKQKRDENIAEYVLYLWQLEDLLRALQLSPEAVFAALVAPRDASDEWKLAAIEWYMDIARLLDEEGKTDGGHLDHSLHIVADMNDLHLTLLEQPVGRRYRELFADLAPELPRLRETLGRGDASDTELMFRALYAAMLYRIKGAKGGANAGSANGREAKDGGEATKDISSTNAGWAKSDGGFTNGGGSTNGGVDSSTDKRGIADEVIALVSPVVALLSDMYHKVERGEIDLYRGN